MPKLQSRVSVLEEKIIKFGANAENMTVSEFLRVSSLKQARRNVRVASFGSLQGKIRISDDFDEELDDFQEYW